MTDYVISEETVQKVNDLLSWHYTEELTKMMDGEIRSRQLSEELKKERERVLDKLQSMYVQAYDDPNVSDREKLTFKMIDGFIESLRGEP
jgi:hypothetical protein